MAARIIHFGWDDCYRVPVLRSAGYEVSEAGSLLELRADLERDDAVGAVFVSEDEDGTAEQAAEIAIANDVAPVILFRRRSQAIDESKFDRIFNCTVPPAVWVGETAELIAKGRELIEKSRRLRAEIAVEQAKLLSQRMRARCLRAMKPGPS